MDVLTPEQRRKNMQHIKAKDTRPELLLRRKLWAAGFRYRKNYKGLPGSPDIVFLKQKVAVFIDGEFWHGYNWEKNRKRIGTHREFWIKKIEDNMERDRKNISELESAGWTVLRFWSRDVLKNTDSCIKIIKENLKY